MIILGQVYERIEISQNREGLFLENSFGEGVDTSVFQQNTNQEDWEESAEKVAPSRELSEELISKVVSETLLQQSSAEKRSITEIRVFYSDGSFETFVLK